MSLNFSSTYFSVVATGISICAVKATFVHLLTVRERLMTDVFVEPKDVTIVSPLRAMFMTLTGCVVGSSCGGAIFVARCERIGKNIAENEPFFFLVALAYGTLLLSDNYSSSSSSSTTSSSTTVETAVTLVQVYTASRVAHTLVYLTNVGFSIGLRGLSYVVGITSGLAMVYLTLQQTK